MVEPVKPGYKSSEFLVSVLMSALIAGLTALVAAADALPGVPRAIVLALGPFLIGMLGKSYNEGRVSLKMATIAREPFQAGGLKSVIPMKGPTK